MVLYTRSWRARTSTSRSPTWCVASRRTPRSRTSCTRCSRPPPPGVRTSEAGAHAGSDKTAGSAMDRQEAVYRASVALGTRWTDTDVTPRRQVRGAVGPGGSAAQGAGPEQGGFRNASDTDPAVAANRAWAARIVGPDSGTCPRSPRGDQHGRGGRRRRARREGRRGLGAGRPADRARALRAVAARLEEARTDLVTAMVHEPGKTVAEADPEVSEAVDFANYYAQSAEALEQVPGARFTPHGVTLVTRRGTSRRDPRGRDRRGARGGSAVIAKPAPSTPRCLEVAVDAIHAGLADAVANGPAESSLTADAVRDVVQLTRVPDGDLGRHLVTHEGIARVILTGAIETAQMFASWRPGLDVLAETSGKNAIVVTPSADLDLAVADVVRSAFGHAGQKCSAASLVILVGSVGDQRTATGRRFAVQLVDAVRSLAVGPATDVSTTMGPLTEVAEGKLLRALTALEPGSSGSSRHAGSTTPVASGRPGCAREWRPARLSTSPRCSARCSAS
ncbi:aldehyde dehydrogenase family protein [Oerskovia sp. M15]